MYYAIFIYNVLLIVLFAMNIGCFALSYTRTKKMLDIWVAGMFLLFIAENLILYMADFIEAFAAFYNAHTVTEPVLKTALSMGIYVCYLFIGAGLVGKKTDSQSWIIYGVYVAALLLVPLLPTSRFTYWLYFTLSQIMFAYIALRCYADSAGMYRNPEQQAWLRRVLKVSLALNALIVLEDAIVIFFFDELNPEALRITQRNLCEDAQSIYFGVIGLRFFFSRFFSTVDEAPQSNEFARFMQTNEDIRKRQAEALCAECGLTGREGEILVMLLANKANKEISEELYISHGTVKNHIHSIYQKTETRGRAQLMRRVKSIIIEEVLAQDEI